MLVMPFGRWGKFVERRHVIHVGVQSFVQSQRNPEVGRKRMVRESRFELFIDFPKYSHVRHRITQSVSDFKSLPSEIIGHGREESRRIIVVVRSEMFTDGIDGRDISDTDRNIPVVFISIIEIGAHRSQRKVMEIAVSVAEIDLGVLGNRGCKIPFAFFRAEFVIEILRCPFFALLSESPGIRAVYTNRIAVDRNVHEFSVREPLRAQQIDRKSDRHVYALGRIQRNLAVGIREKREIFG